MEKIVATILAMVWLCILIEHLATEHLMDTIVRFRYGQEKLNPAR
jgi:hypothetical protein